MFNITQREHGKCAICSEETDVVTLTKDGSPMRLCKRHAWDALAAPRAKKPTASGEPDAPFVGSAKQE